MLKVPIFSYISRLVRTQVNADNGQLFCESNDKVFSYNVTVTFWTVHGYLRTVYFE